MLRWFATVAVAATMLVGAPAQAATMTAFESVTNDGVFTLTAEQKAFFGTTATRIGFLRARAADGGTIAAGASFNAATVERRCSRNCGMVDRILNGNAAGLTYTGGYLEALGRTTVNAEGPQFVNAVAFLFTGNNITFNGTRSGTATFSASATRGTFDFAVPQPAAVPLPAAGWLLVAGLGGLAALRRRKAAAA